MDGARRLVDQPRLEYSSTVQVVCGHCGNQVYAEHGDTGIVDEFVKRVGWRRASAPRKVAPPLDVDSEEVAAELRELGLDASGSEVSGWLAEEGATDPDLEERGGMARVAGWLERKEASVTPVRPEIFDKATASTIQRGDIAWQRAPEGLLACSHHCFEQLAVCTRCGIRRTATEHRGCGSYVARCTAHRPPSATG